MDSEPPSLFTISFLENSSAIGGTFLFVILLIASALISGAEVALFSLSRLDIKKGLESHPKTFSVIADLLEKPKKLLATILVANNFINIGIVILFAFLGEIYFESIKTPWIKFLLEVVLVTFLILLFGEIVPKIYASRNKIKFASFMAKPLKVLDFIFAPISSPMQFVTIAIQNKLGKQKSHISVDQLSQALELTSDEDTSIEEHKILKGIVSFGNTDTKQVMRPRMDIFALQAKMSFSEIIPEITKNGYSRIPVYKDNIDSVIGILYVKDLLPHLDKKDFDWVSLLREPFFVPENKKLDDLMIEFQEKKVHLAVVVDEYGGTSGVVSLEDVIEEIVGDISDEFDDDDLIYSIIDDKNFTFDGKTPLKDFYRIVDLDEADEADFEAHRGEAETIAGFVLEISGVFPRQNSKINFKKFVFTVEAIEKKRLKQIKFTILD